MLVAVTLAASVVCLGLVFGVLVRSRVRVDAGHALVISKMNARTVAFTDAIVFPIVHRGELVDLSVQRIMISRKGKEGLICADRIRADADVTFLVRVNRTIEDVLRVSETVGAKRASDPATLETLFSAKFSDALKTVAAKLDFDELYSKREEFRDTVMAVVGRDLNGFVLDDIAIDYLEQTPIAQLDPNNILDAEGIRKITQATKSALSGVDMTQKSDRPKPFADKLADRGLLDITVAIEVSAATASDRELEGRIAAHRDVLARVVAPSLLDALADAHIASGAGTVRVRFHTFATEQQVLDAARLVHALRQDTSIFR